jgi:hypothetical protein
MIYKTKNHNCEKTRKQRKNVQNEEQQKEHVQGENVTYRFRLWNGKDVKELALYRLYPALAVKTHF